MFGTRMNNAQIAGAVEAGAMELEPFDSSLLKLDSYPLNPGVILAPVACGSESHMSLEKRHDFAADARYVLEPNEFVVVEVRQFLCIAEGIEGDFAQTSSMIDKGLLVMHGRFEFPFGKFSEKASNPDAEVRQKIRFGLKNLLNQSVGLVASDEISHVRFTDFRGLSNLPYKLRPTDVARILNKTSSRYERAMDDGPIYDE